MDSKRPSFQVIRKLMDNGGGQVSSPPFAPFAHVSKSDTRSGSITTKVGKSSERASCLQKKGSRKKPQTLLPMLEVPGLRF